MRTLSVSWIASVLVLALAMINPLSAIATEPASNAAGATQGATTQSLTTVPAARFAERVVVITIEGPIDRHVQASFERRLKEAEKGGAQAVVLELNTPGGELGAVLGMCSTLKNSPIKNTVAWIHPEAYSGGSILALACREIVLSESSTMGDSLIITIGSLGQLNILPESERQKALSPLLAEVVNSARLRGYDEKLVQGFVTLGVELWMVESVDKPGTFVFIDRNEYKLLFGTEPVANSATNTGAAPLPPEAKAAQKQIEDQAAQDARDGAGALGGRKSGGEGRRQGGGGALLPRDASASPFQPASPAMGAGLLRSTDSQMTQRSARPVFTAADQGKWKVVEFVCDGRGVLTLKNDTLFRYGLAQQAGTANGTITNDEELKAFFGAKNLARLDMNWAERTAQTLSNPVLQGVLVVIFLIAMFVEITHPGVILPGTVAAIALFLLAAPMFFAGFANWWAVVAVVLGIGLLGLEIFVLPGFGVFGILGLLMLFGGLIGLLVPAGAGGLFPDSPEGQSQMLTAVATLAISTVTAIGAMYFIGKNFGSLPILNRFVLQDSGSNSEGEELLAAAATVDPNAPVQPGQEGEAMTPLRPSGRVRIGEEVVDVVADSGFIAAGVRVRVLRLEGMRVVVEKA
ncbi:MAG: hypothetical protein IBJ18_10710 [Phycisphaerales bacterium]|nr:hypothetical protein [Phycisphaerales bacterium]